MNTHASIAEVRCVGGAELIMAETFPRSGASHPDLTQSADPSIRCMDDEMLSSGVSDGAGSPSLGRRSAAVKAKNPSQATRGRLVDHWRRGHQPAWLAEWLS